MTEKYFTRKQAAAFLTTLGCPVTYLQMKRWGLKENFERGPSYTIIRKRIVRYSETDLRFWASENSRKIE